MQCGSGRRFLSLRPAACPIFSFFFGLSTEPRVSVNIFVPETHNPALFFIFLWPEHWASGLCEHFYPWDPRPDLILYFSLVRVIRLGSLQTFLSLRPVACPIPSFFFGLSTEPRVSANIFLLRDPRPPNGPIHCVHCAASLYTILQTSLFIWIS